MWQYKVFGHTLVKHFSVSFARQYFGDKFRYQYDNATPHHAPAVIDFLQQGNVTTMEQPAGCQAATT